MSNPPPDFILGTMNLLKSAWQLTGSLASNNINFMTGYYQEQLRLPAVIITPLVEPMRLLHIGNKAQYKVNHIIQCHIFVQPPTASNTALGQAKNARYQIQQEVERIIRSGSTLIPGTQYAKISESFGREIMNVNPPILGWEVRVNTVDFRL